MSKVIYEGWMVRYGRRKIGRSFIHRRYFVLEPRLLAYYKKKPQDNRVPIKTLLIDGNCRVEDRGLKAHHGHFAAALCLSGVLSNWMLFADSLLNTLYVLSVYNKKDKYNRITMAAFNIQEVFIWKEKIEFVIDQHQESQVPNGNKYISFEYKSGMDNGRTASSSDCESQFSAQEDEEDNQPNLLRRTTMGNGPPASVFDWTQEFDSELTNQNANNQVFSRKHWRLLQCQNGLRIFEELLEVDYLPRSCSRAMKAVGVVEASCEEVFELIMSMDATRFDWDCSFQYGSIVEEVDGHTAILHHVLQLDWFPIFVWPRDLCYVRYWRRNDDGSYVVLFRSREHENCGPRPGFVRAHIESGGFNISPLKPRNGKHRTQMLNSVAGLREWFSQTDERSAPSRIPAMDNMINAASQNSGRRDGHSEQISEEEQEASQTKHENNVKRTGSEEEPVNQIDLSCFSGNLRRDDRDNTRDCWRISDGNNFRVRSKHFCFDKSKVHAGKHLLDLVAVDWFKDTKRMDHVVRRQGCAAQVASEKGLFSVVFNLQVPASTHYSMVFYFVTREIVPGSLLQRFVDGDDEFRNSRLKLIPSVPKGSWIVRQSVGSTPCLLGKAVDCNYIRGPNYLEVDVDIGSSTVANGVLGLVIGVITSLVVDMAFLVQANATEELPERLIGAVRVSHIELSSAIVPKLDPETS
ncbi:hypothetical protein OIU84_004303 [Salix udensis]|uniref:Protein ENHANCED DISEASE RESISTANCE 2-like n=1 Tax=Salix udensis TaxID=889485 RepID=A0AAD6K1Z5_9ROSI|nr:hypothetical protein OIU84_004303 [Salix udensis]